MTKMAENQTLWGHTYLYCPYKGVPLQAINEKDRNLEQPIMGQNVLFGSLWGGGRSAGIKDKEYDVKRELNLGVGLNLSWEEYGY